MRGGCEAETVERISRELLEGRLDGLLKEETVDELWEVSAWTVDYKPPCMDIYHR